MRRSGAADGADRARTGGEQRRVVPPQAEDPGVTNRVHPVVHHVQRAACDAMIDRRRPEPAGTQLPPAHDAALARGELGEERLRVRTLRGLAAPGGVDPRNGVHARTLWAGPVTKQDVSVVREPR